MVKSLLDTLSYFILSVFVTTDAIAEELETPSFPVPWQMNLQNPATPVAERLIEFHNFLLVIIIIISLIVLGLLIWCAIRYNSKANPIPSKNTHNTLIEVLWTVIPIIILLIIAVPSYRLLYFMDRIEDPELTVKVVGNQWYWTYEFPDYEIEFDSLPIPDNEIDITKGQHRLFEVDTPLILPINTDIRILFTSNDVLHAWTVPAFGVKLDTVPGRINETWTHITRKGKFYGQCSELCGINHSAMPIVVHAVSKEDFEKWRQNQTALNIIDTQGKPSRLALISKE